MKKVYEIYIDINEQGKLKLSKKKTGKSIEFFDEDGINLEKIKKILDKINKLSEKERLKRLISAEYFC